MSWRETHDELADLLGAYALDAVEPEEAELVARHLELCPRCRAELADHRETAALLGYIGGPAPVGLWDQIAASAQVAPPALRLVAPSARPTSGARRRRSLRVRTVAIAAGIAAGVVAVLGVQLSRLDNRTQTLTEAVHNLAPAASPATVRAALVTPGARVVHLRPLTAAAGAAEAVLLPSGTGYLYHASMVPLPSERTYQLWGVVGDQRISYGLIGSDPTAVTPFRAGGNVQALAVTDEVAGGVEQSTQPLVVVGGVSGPRPAPPSRPARGPSTAQR